MTVKGTGTEKGQMNMDRRTGTVTDIQGQEQGKEDRNGDLRKWTWKGGLGQEQKDNRRRRIRKEGQEQGQGDTDRTNGQG